VSGADVAPLRVALLFHDYASPSAGGTPQSVHLLAATLHARGHVPTVLAARKGLPSQSAEDGFAVVRNTRLPELPLHRRGFTGPLTHLPASYAALLTGPYDVAHAFSAADAAAALLWRRRSGRPVVFTCAEVLERAALSGERLRLRMLADAVERTDAVLATTAEGQHALARWLAAQAMLVEPGDALAHERLYRALAARRNR
jgi:hypothetical protein